MPRSRFELPAKIGFGRSKLGVPGHIYPEIKGQWLNWNFFFLTFEVAKLEFFFWLVIYTPSFLWQWWVSPRRRARVLSTHSTTCAQRQQQWHSSTMSFCSHSWLIVEQRWTRNFVVLQPRTRIYTETSWSILGSGHARIISDWTANDQEHSYSFTKKERQYIPVDSWVQNSLYSWPNCALLD